MKWTMNKPKEPGWYWCERAYMDSRDIRVVEVSAVGTSFYATYTCAGDDEAHCFYLDDPYYNVVRWAGPIEPPEEVPC